MVFALLEELEGLLLVDSLLVELLLELVLLVELVLFEDSFETFEVELLPVDFGSGVFDFVTVGDFEVVPEEPVDDFSLLL